MPGKTSIQWTDATWNPVRGCSRISLGCEHCYAETMASRFTKPGQAFHTFAADGRWTRKVQLVERMLDLPMHWKTPRRIFVNSMSDLFHESLSALAIGRVFEVMERCPQHTFQVLTKRADVMQRWMATEYATEPPPANVWLGVSVEDQRRADERIPLLLETPAAVRFLSVEPLLEHVALRCTSHLSWVIVGGESGAGARPFDLAWARSIVRQCKAAGVPVFVKQLGPHPSERAEANLGARQGYDPSDLLAGASEPRPPQMKGWTRIHTATETFYSRPLRVIDHKGGDPAEWPADLRVREFPHA